MAERDVSNDRDNEHVDNIRLVYRRWVLKSLQFTRALGIPTV